MNDCPLAVKYNILNACPKTHTLTCVRRSSDQPTDTVNKQ